MGCPNCTPPAAEPPSATVVGLETRHLEPCPLSPSLGQHTGRCYAGGGAGHSCSTIFCKYTLVQGKEIERKKKYLGLETCTSRAPSFVVVITNLGLETRTRLEPRPSSSSIGFYGGDGGGRRSL
jgi:hypothetical protein